MKQFHNPYNFVTPIRKENIGSENTMGRCPPPPHDRYVGYSGQLSCTITTVTPLFISDSEGITKENGHQRYRFFRVHTDANTKSIAIPSTSLRGMLRSVFETITNSCFSVFDDRYIFRRMNPREAPDLTPARIEKDGEKWYIRLFEGYCKDGIDQCAAWVYMKTPNDADRQYKGTSYYKRNKVPGIEKFNDGDLCWAVLRKCRHPKKRMRNNRYHPPFNFWDVVQISTGKLQPEKKGDIVAQGYLYLKGSIWDGRSHGGIKKKNERFFFVYYSEKKNTVDFARRIEVSQEVIDIFKLGLAERDNDSKKIVNRLVWVKKNGNTIDYIEPVSIFKTAFSDTTGIVLDSNQDYGLLPCTNYERLCPSCRVFGWVKNEGDHSSWRNKVAYAGRVQISHALLKRGKTMGEMTLAILSSPKPSTTSFYLLDKKGIPKPSLSYDSLSAQLRGRKHYLFHKEINKEMITTDELSIQNRTILDPVDVGSQFTFIIRFNNLSSAELGALFWSLKLENGMHHRLGFAKPFGFGSCKIQILLDSEDTFLLDFKKRYAVESGSSRGKTKIDTTIIQGHINTYQDSMKEVYGKNNYDRIISELSCILTNRNDGIPIHYPLCEDAVTLTKSYEWFMNARGSSSVLPRPTDRTSLERVKCKKRNRVRSFETQKRKSRY